MACAQIISATNYASYFLLLAFSITASPETEADEILSDEDSSEYETDYESGSEAVSIGSDYVESSSSSDDDEENINTTE